MKRSAAALAAILASFAVLFGVFLLREFLIIREQGILPNMLVRWHLARAFLGSMEWAPLAQAAVILVAFGIFKDETRIRDASASLLANSRGLLTAIMALFALYSFLYVFSAPDARKEEGRIRKASAAFSASLKAAETALEAQRWDDAFAALDACAAIDRDDKNYIEMRGRYDRRPGAATPDRANGTTEAPAANTELTANDYYLRARQARAKGDLYTAHSLATKAYRIDPKRLDAQRLASEIWEAISTMKDSQAEDEQRKLALEKLEAYKTLQSGDPVGAYAKFLELKKKSPKDEDIDEYLKQSLEEAKAISFFKDEIARLSYLRSVRGIFFRTMDKDGSQGFLACDTAYFGVQRAYMSGVEYLRLSAAGETLTRVTAPYAKLQDDRLLLACYDKEDPGKAFLPVFYVREKGAIAANFIQVPFRLPELKLASIAVTEPASCSIIEIESVRRGAKRIGADPAPFVNEGLMRIQACVAFLILSLMCLYVGNRFRYRGEKTPIASAVIAFPVGVFVSGVFLQSWAWLGKTVMAALLRDLPAVAVPAFIVVQAASLALAFVILAGYRDVPSD